MSPPFRLPVLLLGCLELPTLFSVANELGGIQPLYGSLNFTQWRCLAHFIDQHSGEIGVCAGQITNEFQKADGLGHPQRPTVIFGIVLESLGNLVNVSAFLVREVALHQLEYLVERHKCPNGLLGECRAIRHQHLVRLLDDRTVAATVMPWSPWLKSNARHDPDAEIDVMWRIGIKVNEITFVDVGATSRAFEP